MKLLFTTLIVAALGAGFFLSYTPRTITIGAGNGGDAAHSGGSAAAGLPEVPEADGLPAAGLPVTSENGDIEKQFPLAIPPAVVKAIYATSWSAGSPARVKALMQFIKTNGLNGIVIDIKDYSGYVAYRTGIPEVEVAGAEKEIRIARPNALIKELHDAGIYVIGRITVFQDPVLAKAHPEWAVQDKRTGKPWVDNHKLSWMDPGARGAWDYVVALGKDAAGRGFDEVNFDYVRFPSDGELEAMAFPFWNGAGTKHAQIAKFFSYLREALKGTVISADMFGLTTVATDDLGIGQTIEDAYASFDYVAPMIYPSHFGKGFIGYKNPAQYPYEVVRYALEGAVRKLTTYNRQLATEMSTTTATSSPAGSKSLVVSGKSGAKLRPWLQAFDLGAVYDRSMIQAQIKATEDALANGSSSEAYAGWLLWDPRNLYARY